MHVQYVFCSSSSLLFALRSGRIALGKYKSDPNLFVCQMRGKRKKVKIQQCSIQSSMKKNTITGSLIDLSNRQLVNSFITTGIVFHCWLLCIDCGRWQACRKCVVPFLLLWKRIHSGSSFSVFCSGTCVINTNRTPQNLQSFIQSSIQTFSVHLSNTYLDTVEIIYCEYRTSLIFISNKCKSLRLSCLLIANQIYIQYFTISVASLLNILSK